MNLNKPPKQVLEKLLDRSRCQVQVAALLMDKVGIFAWGWNSEGQTGLGEHAEMAAMRRCNFHRVPKAVMWIAARRKKSQNPVNSRPCGACWPAVSRCAYVVYRNKAGEWKIIRNGTEL